MSRAFDVVVFGATGFTGGLVCSYLSRNAPDGLRWGIAGRSADKLRRVAEGLAGPHRPADVIVADAASPSSMRAMAQATRVLLTSVGPYAEHGDPALDACVDAGTDYCDITGEPAFVDRSIARHDARARDNGIRVVHCCGFDSIPHDLGAQFTAELLPRDGRMTIEAFVRSRGSFSGGTLHSALGAMSRLREVRPRAPRTDGEKKVRISSRRVRWVPELGAWGCPLPTIDPQIVARSARVLPEFGPEPTYGHYARVRRISTVVGGLAAVGGLVALAQLGPARSLLGRLRSQGEGPSEEERRRSWFEVTFLGEAGGKKVQTSVSGGDPGYDETAKMIAESALCLALDRDKLPSRAGVLTTAVAMGPILRARLIAAGLRFQIKRGG